MRERSAAMVTARRIGAGAPARIVRGNACHVFAGNLLTRDQPKLATGLADAINLAQIA